MFEKIKLFIVKLILTKKEKSMCLYISDNLKIDTTKNEYFIDEENRNVIKNVIKNGVNPLKIFKIAEWISGEKNGGNWKALIPK